MKKKLIISAFLITSLLTSSVVGLADDLSDAESQKNSVDSKINNVTKQKQEEKNKLNNIQKEKANLQSSQTKAQAELSQTQSQLSVTTKEVKAMDTAVKDAEDKYAKQMELFKNRIRLLYQNSQNSYVSTFLKSSNINDFLGKMQTISMIGKRDKELANEVEQAKKDLEFKKRLKEEEQAKIQKQAEEKQRAVQSLQASRSQKEVEERKVSESLKKLEQEENNLLKKSEELSNLINTITIRRKGGYVEGQMVWPTPNYGQVTSPFGNRRHPVLGVNRMHTGIDINAPMSAAIVSANKGTVIYAGWQDGYGNTVIVDHGGNITTLYAHTSKILVSVGQEVEAGTAIAKVGSTGLSTGPHLHFEVRYNGGVVDPLQYVSP